MTIPYFLPMLRQPQLVLRLVQESAFMEASTICLPTCCGNTYRLSSCGSSDIVDTRLSVYANASGGSSVAFNDDFCGLRAQLDFTPATTGSYRILLDETGPGATCAGGFSDPDCGEIVVTLISTGPSTAYCVPQYASGSI